jgi:hypothetical protein
MLIRPINASQLRVTCAVLLFLMLLLASCSRNGNKANIVDTSGTSSKLSLGAQALQNLSPFEKRVLKDKKVTLAELLEATQVYEECLTANNINFQQTSATDLGPSGVATLITVPANVKDPDAYDAEMQNKAYTCQDPVSAVEDVWVLQNQASQAQIDKAEKDYVACIRNAGISLPAGATFTQAGSAAKSFVQSLSGNEVDPTSALGIEQTAVSNCMASIAQTSTVALPGLSQALAALNTSGW